MNVLLKPIAINVGILDVVCQKIEEREVAFLMRVPRVYFARAMDGLPGAEIARNYAEVGSLLNNKGMSLVNPFKEEDYVPREDLPANDIDREAKRIVEQDLKRLRNADVLLLDIALAHQCYFGGACEMVYARRWHKLIVVYEGDSGNGSRLWLRYHADHVCRDLSEAVSYLTAVLSSKRRKWWPRRGATKPMVASKS